MKFYFHLAKLSKARLNIFTTQVASHSGQVVHNNNEATHIIVEETCDTQSLPLSLWSGDVVVVGSLWLSQCLKRKMVIDHQQYTITKPTQKRKSPSPENIVVNKLEQELKPDTSASTNELKVGITYCIKYFLF